MSILGQQYLPASTNTTFTVPAGGGTLNILMCNQNSGTQVAVSVALVPNGGSISTASWIEWLTPIDPNQVLERGGIPLGAGDMVVINPAAAGVSVSVVMLAGI